MVVQRPRVHRTSRSGTSRAPRHPRAVRRAAGVAAAALIAAGLWLCPAPAAAAWDSFLGSNSHNAIFEHAYREALFMIEEDPDLPATLADHLAAGEAELLRLCDTEESHGATRTLDEATPVGSNAGTNHPEEYWQAAVRHYRDWQRTGSEASRLAAYTDLGYLVHDIEDQGCPPHAYNAEHGGSDPGSFEILTTTTPYDTYYYREPGDDHVTYDHPGKNVLDTGDHYDGSQLQWRMDYGVYDWRYIGGANMQVPAPVVVVLDVSIVGAGRPDEVYIRARYERSDGSRTTQDFGPFSPRQYRWSRLWLRADDFAPNGDIDLFYMRRESSPLYDWWTGQLQVYVNRAGDIVNGDPVHPLGPELARPTLRHPWQYYDWLRGWTLWATAAPYWRHYAGLSNYDQPFSFGLIWISTPNTERALVSMQWMATQQVLTWFLVEAQQKLDDPSYSPESALGDGYRAVLYEDVAYNGTGARTPEHLYSQAVACEPDPVWGVAAFVPGTATPDKRVPVLDGDYRIVEPVAGAPRTDLATLVSDTLRFGQDPVSALAGRVSSVEVRRAKVTLFSEPGCTGRQLVLTGDVPSLAAPGYAFNDEAQSVKVEPFFFTGMKPDTGPTGAEVWVTGYGFGLKAGRLWFGSQRAKVTRWTDTFVGALVPDGQSGVTPVRLTHADGTEIAESLAFSVRPTLTSVAPRAGAPGREVVLTGTGFGAKRGGNGVLFGSVPATSYPRWTTTSITVTVPKLPPGPTTVSVRTKGGDSETLAFRVR